MELVGEFKTIYIYLGLALVLGYVLFLIRTGRIGSKLKQHAQVWPKMVLRLVYCTLFFLALLAPSFGGSKQEVKSVGKDIMLCIDLSESMNSTDVQPSRLEKVKFELKKVVEQFNSDRIGLIIFSGESYTQCPLTYDQQALFLFIESLSTSLVASTGTHFAPPLRMALTKLTNDDSSVGLQRENKFKIIILASDGEDFDPNTLEVTEEIKEQGLKLFTLGVGTSEGSRIPEANGRGYLRDDRGNEVVSTLNSDPLKELASMTDGRYFEISDEKNDVQRMIAYLANLEGSVADARTIDVSANKFSYFLAAGMLLLLLDLLLTKRLFQL